MFSRWTSALALMAVFAFGCARPPLTEQRTTIDPHSALVEKRQGDRVELRYVEGTDAQGTLNYRGYLDLQSGEVSHYDIFREGKLVARFHGNGTLWKQFDDNYPITRAYQPTGEYAAVRRLRQLNEGLEQVDKAITIGQDVAGTISSFPRGGRVSSALLGL